MGSSQPFPDSNGIDVRIGAGPVLHRYADDTWQKAAGIFDIHADTYSRKPDRVSLYFVIDEMNFKKRADRI